MKSCFTTILLLIFTQALAQISTEDLSFHSSFEKGIFEKIEQGEEINHLALLMASDAAVDSQMFLSASRTLDSFNLRKRLFRSPNRLFYHLQRKYMASFKHYDGFVKLFTDTTFNCVTGTALLAYMYQKNDFQYVIHERPYHTYLTVQKGRKTFVAESTDEYFGFRRMTQNVQEIYDDDTVDTNPIFQMLGNYPQLPKDGFTIYNEISLSELCGLLYYNEAVRLLQYGELDEAIVQLEKAFFLYESERIMTLLKFILMVRLNSDISLETKKCYYAKLERYQNIYHWVARFE